MWSSTWRAGRFEGSPPRISFPRLAQVVDARLLPRLLPRVLDGERPRLAVLCVLCMLTGAIRARAAVKERRVLKVSEAGRHGSRL